MGFTGTYERGTERSPTRGMIFNVQSTAAFGGSAPSLSVSARLGLSSVAEDRGSQGRSAVPAPVLSGPKPDRTGLLEDHDLSSQSSRPGRTTPLQRDRRRDQDNYANGLFELFPQFRIH